MGLFSIQQPIHQFLCKAAKNVGKQKEWKYGDVIKALIDLI